MKNVKNKFFLLFFIVIFQFDSIQYISIDFIMKSDFVQSKLSNMVKNKTNIIADNYTQKYNGIKTVFDSQFIISFVSLGIFISGVLFVISQSVKY